MAYYYLVASLPQLALDKELPITSESFLSACAGQLSGSDMADVSSIQERRFEDVVNPAFRSYIAKETQLRDALARARAARAGVDAAPFEQPFAGFDVQTERVATEAMGAYSPLDRELVLDRYRFKLLDELAVPSPFGTVAVLAYAEKLLIAERWQALTEELGRSMLEQIVEDNVAGIDL